MAKPTNSIKKIKVGDTTYDIVPNMVTDGTYKASCPTLTADATLATTNDLTNNIKEAYLKWGGRNISGSYAPIDACMNPVLSPNRIAGMNPNGITVEYTNDGTTWTDYGLTDAQKKSLVTTSQSIVIGKTGNKTVNSKVRVTLDGVNGSVYTALNKMHIYITTNYSNGCKVTMESYDYNSSTTWHTVISDQPISGWSGWNVLNFTLPGTGAFGGTNSNTHQRKIRLTFSHTSISAGHESAGLTISKIYAYGGVGWTTPSTLASNGVPYSYDYAGNITCMGTLRATSLNENGTALSSKYLAKSSTSGLVKNDGTIDTTSYYPSSNPSGYTSNVGTVTKVNNTSPDSSGNVTITIPTPDYPVTNVKIGNTSIVSNKVATIQTNSAYDASTNKIATMSDIPSVPTTYLKSASTNGNTLTIVPASGSNVVFTPTFTEQHIGDVVSVGATSGSKIAIGGTTANPTVGVASGYSIPSTTKQNEWDAKGTVSSVQVQASDCITSSQSTAQTSTLNTTIKHSELNTSGAQTTKSLYLIKIDKYGHITEAEETSLSEYTGEASGAVTYDIYNGSMSYV